MARLVSTRFAGVARWHDVRGGTLAESVAWWLQTERRTQER